MHREGTFNTDTIRELTDGKGLANASTLSADYYTLENLDTALGAFDNPNMNLDLIARAEVNNALFERGGINRIQNVHG